MPSRLPIGFMVFDLLQNAFALDSKLMRSIYPFLLKPGFLTAEYLAGRRMHYVNPFRLYLIMSLVMFGAVSFIDDKDYPNEEKKKTAYQNSKGEEQVPQDSSETNQADSTRDYTVHMSVNNSYVDRLESLFNSLNGISKDSLRVLVQKEDSILLSHNLESNAFNKMLLKQGSKLMYDSDSFSDYLMSKVPTTVFFMLPFYALFVQLVYWRKGYFYIDHLVHIFHIHSFIFFLLTVFSLGIVTGLLESIPQQLLSLLVLVYLYFSIRVVYLQRRWTTILSIMGLGLVYLVVVSIFLGISALYSLVMF